MLKVYSVFDDEMVVQVYPDQIVIRGWKGLDQKHTITIQELRYLLEEITKVHPETMIITGELGRL